jgi:teichuronic acid exporter
VVMALGGIFLIAGFRTVPFALLQRGLRFRSVGLGESGSAAVGATVAIALALADAGYWALVGSQLATALALSAYAVYLAPCRFARPRAAALREALHFSGRTTTTSLAWYTYTNADLLVAGRLLGAGPLGLYSFALSLVHLPTEKIGTIVSSLTPAFMAEVQHDLASVRRLLLDVSEGVALLVLPATVGLALVAHDLVPLAFGRHWSGSVPLVELLAAYATLRALQPVQNNALVALGDVRFNMWLSVAAAAAFPLAFVGASRWGVVGIASVWLALYPLLVAAGFARLVRRGALTVRDYFRALGPAVSGTLVMTLVVLAVRGLVENTPAAARVATEVLTGMVAYAVALRVLHPARVRYYLTYWATARGSTSDAVDSVRSGHSSHR